MPIVEFYSMLSAINETTVTVTFEEDQDVTEEKIKDAKISLTSGDEVLEAKFHSLSQDKNTATFVLMGEDKLVDAKTYTVETNFLNFKNSSFMAKVKGAYAKEFTAVTTDVIAGASANVYFEAFNQYGEKFDLSKNIEVTVSGTLNGMPLNSTELPAYVESNGYIVVNHSLKENDELVLKITSKNGDVSTIKYTVIKGEAVELNSVSLSATETNIAFGENTTLTLTAKDQYNNPFNVDSKVRWFIDGVETSTSTNATLNLTSALYGKQGTHVIKAFYADNTKKSAEITINVGAAKLTTLTAVSENPATTYNLDEIITSKLTGTEGAILTADMIKFHVTAVDTTVEGITEDDISVSAKLRGGNVEGTKNDIVVSAKSTKPGKYTITPYIGESFTDDKAIKASDIVITTTVDQTIKSMDAINFTASELKTGKDVTKTVVFRNKHNEEVVPSTSAVTTTVVPATGLNVTPAVKDGKFQLTFNATAAKNYQVVIAHGDIFKSYSLSFVAPKFTSLELGNDVTGVVAGDAESKAKTQAVKFFDQDAQEMSVKSSELAVTVVKPDGSELDDAEKLVKLGKTYSVSEDGKVTFEASDDDNDIIKGIQVLPDSSLAQGKYTVKVTSTTDNKISDSFTVTVGEARKFNKLEVSSTKVTLTNGSETEVILTSKDQYNDFIAQTITAESNNSNVTVSPVEAVEEKGQTIGYKVTLTGAAKGTSTISFKIGDKVHAQTTVTVDSVAQLVNSISFDASKFEKLYSTESQAEVDILSAVTAFDAQNSKLPINKANVGLRISAVNSESTDAPTIEDGKLKVASDFVGTVTVEAQLGSKTAEITLSFDNKTAAPVKGTTAVKEDIDEDKNTDGIQVIFEESESTTEFKLVGKDQYNKNIDIDFTDSNLSIVSDDSSVVTVSKNSTEDKLTLTKGSKGTANVIINFNGDRIVINVTVK